MTAECHFTLFNYNWKEGSASLGKQALIARWFALASVKYILQNQWQRFLIHYQFHKASQDRRQFKVSYIEIFKID